MNAAEVGRVALDVRTIQDHFPGIGRFAYNLALALADELTTDRLLLLHDPSQRNTRFDLTPLRAHPAIDFIDCAAPNFSLREQVRIPALLHERRAKLYHSFYYIYPYRVPCASVVTIHDLIPLLYPAYFTLPQRLIFALTVRLALRTARHITADSQSTAADLTRLLRVPPERITVISGAADPAMTRPSDTAIAALRHRYQLPGNFVLYLGSNKPHKNLARLVTAYAAVAQRAHFPLVIAGHWDDYRYPEAKVAAETLGLGEALRWLGPVPQADLPALYAAAALFVFPSEYEGFGLPVLEAMACGTPVICSNSSSLPEVAGDAARLVSPTDTAAWSAALAQLLAEPATRADLADRGLRQARRFSWSVAARQLLSVYASA